MSDVKLPTNIPGTKWFVDACTFKPAKRLSIEPFWDNAGFVLTFGFQIEILGRGFQLSIIKWPKSGEKA